MSMMSLATWAALPTSVWMRMYAVTTDTDLLASWRPRRPERLVPHGMVACGGRSGDHLRQDRLNRWSALKGRGGRVPGFEPDQPRPTTFDASTVVRLSCRLATDVCSNVQVYPHRL
jgi:hypothetical protein